jgi:hypothetical protein
MQALGVEERMAAHVVSGGDDKLGLEQSAD